MIHPVNRGVVAILAVVLAVLAGVAGVIPKAASVASAGTVHASASPILILNTTPWNGQILGSATPTIVIVYGDANLGATVIDGIFHLDGMNLTSAGSFNRSTFVLPLALDLRNGPHLASLSVFDNVGGVGGHNWSFTVDTVPPVLLVTAPAYPTVPTTGVLVAGTAVLADPVFGGAGPINVSATVLPLRRMSWTFPAANGSFVMPVPLSEGANAIFVNATDRLGNFATVIKYVVRDTTKPLLVLLTPASQVSPTNSVWVSGRTEPGAFVLVDGFSVAVSPLDGSWGVNLTLPDGINIITVAAADQVGNVNYTGLGILVDSDPPKVTLDSPAQALTNQPQVVVSGTVTDTRLVVLLVNGLPVSWNASGSFRTTLTLPEGNDPIVIVAVDAAQHTTLLRRMVTVDTTPPVVQISAPPDGLETNQSTVVLRGTVDDVNATVLVNGQMLRPDAGGHWQTTVALMPGGNLVLVSAIDPAGNQAATITLRIEFFSPFPDLENRTSANARSLDELGGMVRLSLVGILLLAIALELVLFSRASNKIRETRTLLAAVLRERKREPKP